VAKQGAILPSGLQLFSSLFPSITLDDTQMPTESMNSLITLDDMETSSNEELSEAKNKNKIGSRKGMRTTNGRVSKELRNLQSFIPDPKAKTLRRTRSTFESENIPKRKLRLLF
jgi:hypothetical protein